MSQSDAPAEDQRGSEGRRVDPQSVGHQIDRHGRAAADHVRTGSKPRQNTRHLGVVRVKVLKEDALIAEERGDLLIERRRVEIAKIHGPG